MPVVIQNYHIDTKTRLKTMVEVIGSEWILPHKGYRKIKLKPEDLSLIIFIVRRQEKMELLKETRKKLLEIQEDTFFFFLQILWKMKVLQTL